MMAFLKHRFETPVSANASRAMTTLSPRGDSYVRIDNRDYPIHQWSPAGFTAAPYNGSLIRRQKARVSITLRDIQDPDGPLRVDGEVLVDMAEDGVLSARWVGLPKYKTAAMAAYFARKLGA